MKTVGIDIPDDAEPRLLVLLHRTGKQYTIMITGVHGAPPAEECIRVVRALAEHLMDREEQKKEIVN